MGSGGVHRLELAASALGEIQPLDHKKLAPLGGGSGDFSARIRKNPFLACPGSCRRD
ncbi:hypothetical protein MPNT_230039 [Candidatus Methylacidithermus pantelleriae]|uniref:Uncharacterized protein n=1 Tax=Candidatus Methylacidithermus pantelleriae TaxID=2744239 RepID=A0A8J2BKZ4_9BACT|nr:hypothetical protein MPNT_230039 [Candidatus Methylacidithermus pantelleriae]